jgi:hypothetical protein
MSVGDGMEMDGSGCQVAHAVESCAIPTFATTIMTIAAARKFDLNPDQRNDSAYLRISGQRILDSKVSNMTEAADIAVVSFDKFINGNDADKRPVAQQIYNAFSTVGWVYVIDHGIPQWRVDEIFRLVHIPLSAPSDATDA